MNAAVLCAAALIGAAVLAAQTPAHARAPKWDHLDGTFICVDRDSEQFDQDGARWSFEYSYDPACPGGSPVLQAKAECRQQVFGPDFDGKRPLVWHLHDDAVGWIEETEQPDSEGYLMVGAECMGWKDAKDAAGR